MHLKHWFAALAACCACSAADADLRDRLQEARSQFVRRGRRRLDQRQRLRRRERLERVLSRVRGPVPLSLQRQADLQPRRRLRPPLGPQARFEIGGLVKLQTLGFAAGDSEALRGMPDRPWTLEVGSTLGWRGSAIDLDWTTFVDAFRHQTGASHLFRLSWPRRGERGYVVPELALRR